MRLALWMASALLCAGCVSADRSAGGAPDGGPEPDGALPELDAATPDGSGEDAARPDGSLADSGTDAGPSASQPDARVPEPEPEVVGVAFQQLGVRTPDGQTVALQGITGVASMPDGSGLLAWEKSGRITEYRIDGDALVLQGETRLEGVYADNDCGLVALAFDPAWAESRYVFVAHCISPKRAVVVRYDLDGEHYDRVPETASPVIELGDDSSKRPWHNIGAIGFFDDEHDSMWLLVGEKHVPDNAQDLTVDLGKVLRIIPHRQPELSGYEPHPDNPFAGDPELTSGPNLYAWGLRSPWRGTIDAEDRLIIGDVGETAEEVNVASEPGQNFGWSLFDGPCRDRDDCDEMTDPTRYWPRSSDHRYRMDDARARATNSRCAWVGAYYEGDEHDRYDDFLDRAVLFSDMCLGFVRALELDAEGDAIRDEHVGHLPGLSGAAVGPDGYLYVTSFGGCTSNTHGLGGGIFRVLPRFAEDPQVPEPPSAGASLADDPLGPMPLRLSESGLFEDEALSEPLARAVRYEPTLPLWSNGSDKDRFMLLPEGERVDNGERDAWAFPVGTLFVKTFSFADAAGAVRRIETRVIRRLDDQDGTGEAFDYHAYKWISSNRDAQLMSLEQSTPLTVALSEEHSIAHAIPSAFECRMCHESNPTVIIGFDELRLNGPRSGASRSQLEELWAAGVFTYALHETPVRVSHDDERTARVLGYLHGNCAHCHNRGPGSQSSLSLEHSVMLESTINVPTSSSGQAAGIRILPGSPEASVLYQALARTGGRDVAAMPPVGVQEVDEDAALLLHDWILDLQVP